MNEAIFGSFDGLTCVLGLIAAGYLTGNGRVIVLSALALAIGEMVAMFGGEYLSETRQRVGALRSAGIIGLAAGLGAFLPAVPFLFAPKPVALACTLALVAALAVLIAQARVGAHGVMRAYGQTFGLLVAAALLSIGATLAAGLL